MNIDSKKLLREARMEFLRSTPLWRDCRRFRRFRLEPLGDDGSAFGRAARTYVRLVPCCVHVAAGMYLLGAGLSENDAQPQLDDSRVGGIIDHAEAGTPKRMPR